MGFGPIGLPQILIILLIVLLIFGAKRLPEIGSSLGKGIRSFKSSVTGEEESNQTTVKSETSDSNTEPK
ncbi:Sec-independent protein translocase protein TatA [Geodia barretti]|uniref:Sec-independent protein translocase protein TatA n=1 Tax=Geodia barretti TaxID=519541 RepID=A0AA35W2T5_GEOBA|nr:Sec-independent protein translocase protein TatA [Geodia barretti]